MGYEMHAFGQLLTQLSCCGCNWGPGRTKVCAHTTAISWSRTLLKHYYYKDHELHGVSGKPESKQEQQLALALADKTPAEPRYQATPLGFQLLIIYIILF